MSEAIETDRERKRGNEKSSNRDDRYKEERGINQAADSFLSTWLLFDKVSATESKTSH